jgi:hypothetical protein
LKKIPAPNGNIFSAKNNEVRDHVGEETPNAQSLLRCKNGYPNAPECWFKLRYFVRIEAGGKYNYHIHFKGHDYSEDLSPHNKNLETSSFMSRCLCVGPNSDTTYNHFALSFYGQRSRLPPRSVRV